MGKSLDELTSVRGLWLLVDGRPLNASCWKNTLFFPQIGFGGSCKDGGGFISTLRSRFSCPRLRRWRDHLAVWGCSWKPPYRAAGGRYQSAGEAWRQRRLAELTGVTSPSTGRSSPKGEKCGQQRAELPPEEVRQGNGTGFPSPKHVRSEQADHAHRALPSDNPQRRERNGQQRKSRWWQPGRSPVYWG